MWIRDHLHTPDEKTVNLGVSKTQRCPLHRWSVVPCIQKTLNVIHTTWNWFMRELQKTQRTTLFAMAWAVLVLKETDFPEFGSRTVMIRLTRVFLTLLFNEISWAKRTVGMKLYLIFMEIYRIHFTLLHQRTVNSSWCRRFVWNCLVVSQVASLRVSVK